MCHLVTKFRTSDHGSKASRRLWPKGDERKAESCSEITSHRCENIGEDESDGIIGILLKPLHQFFEGMQEGGHRHGSLNDPVSATSASILANRVPERYHSEMWYILILKESVVGVVIIHKCDSDDAGIITITITITIAMALTKSTSSKLDAKLR